MRFPGSHLIRHCAVLLFALYSLPVFASKSDTPPAPASQRGIPEEIETLRTLPMAELEHRAWIFARNLTREEVEIARARVFDAPWSYANDRIGEAIVGRWGEFDGPAAFRFASAIASVRRPSYETSALTGWAKHQPREAWDRMLQVSNRAADQRYDPSALLGVIGEINLPLALELFEDLASDRACLSCNASLLAIHALRHNQLPLVQAEIARLPTGPTRDALRDAYWRVLGQFAREQALSDITGVRQPDDLKAARVQLVSGWAARDFPAALEYVVNHYDQSTTDAAILPMIQVWAYGAAPEDVRAAILKLPGELSERSLLGLAPALARVDPLAATDWAAGIANPAIRRECLTRTMWSWARIDAEPAREYIRSRTDLDTRGVLMRSFLLARVGNATFQIADLDDLLGDYNSNWLAGLLAELSLRLADPSSNRTGMVDLKAYTTWVETKPKLDAQQRARALEPLKLVSK